MTYERPVTSEEPKASAAPEPRNTGSTKDFGSSLADAVRDNPASAALIGMGVAWLFLGGSKTSLFGSRRQSEPEHRYRYRPERDGYEAGFAASERFQGGSDRFGAAAGHVGRAAQETGHTLGSGARQMGSGIADGVSSAADATSQGIGAAASYAGDAASYVASSAYEVGRSGSRIVRSQAEHMHHTIGDFLENQPLALGVLGLAIGAGAASLFPVIDVEKKYVGETSDELKTQARSLFDEKLEQAKDLAATALDEVAREAEAQGLTKAKLGDVGADLKNKATNVAAAARASIGETSTGRS